MTITSTSTDIDRHRIACEVFESQSGRHRSNFRVACKKRLAEFGDHDEALVHCMAMWDHWSKNEITNPSSLTEILRRDDVRTEVDVSEPVVEAPGTLEPPSGEDGFAQGGVEPPMVETASDPGVASELPIQATGEAPEQPATPGEPGSGGSEVGIDP